MYSGIRRNLCAILVRARHEPFNAIIAVATTVYVCFAALQWCVMQNQLTEMKQSFSIDRAYVFNGGFEGYKGTGPFPDQIATITFTNYGKTPADLTWTGGSCVYSQSGYPNIVAPKIQGITDDAGLSPPGTIIDVGKSVGPFEYKMVATNDQISQARIGNGKLYCRGMIGYADVRNTAHLTSVCFTYLFGANAFILTPEKGANFHT